jgi:hypothetical protein
MSDYVEPSPRLGPGSADSPPGTAVDGLPRKGLETIAVCLGLWVLYLAIDASGTAVSSPTVRLLLGDLAVDVFLLALAFMMQRGSRRARAASTRDSRHWSEPPRTPTQ